MAELRWNPLIKDWVMIASHRQNRPRMQRIGVRSVRVRERFLTTLQCMNMIMISLHFHKIRLYRMMLKQEFTRQKPAYGQVRSYFVLTGAYCNLPGASC